MNHFSKSFLSFFKMKQEKENKEKQFTGPKGKYSGDNPFIVPGNFFETNADEILARKDKAFSIRPSSKNFFRKYSPAAAVIIVLLSFAAILAVYKQVSLKKNETASLSAEQILYAYDQSILNLNGTLIEDFFMEVFNEPDSLSLFCLNDYEVDEGEYEEWEDALIDYLLENESMY